MRAGGVGLGKKPKQLKERTAVLLYNTPICIITDAQSSTRLLVLLI